MNTPGSTLFEWTAFSDLGKRRKNNEDAWAAWALGEIVAWMPAAPQVWPAAGFLLVVSDGMGGALAGEVASAFCASRIARDLHVRRKEPDREKAMREAFLATHEALIAEASADPTQHGMGATLTVLWLLADGELIFGHIGDSRLYARQDGAWRLLSEDQNVGAGMIRRGEMTAAEVNRLRYRSMLEQVMGGTGVPLSPQIGRGRWQPGAAFALCSDGLHGPLEQGLEARWETACSRESLEAGARGLVDEANEVGGPDNITVLLARFMPEARL